MNHQNYSRDQKIELVRALSLGARVAEEEVEQLQQYFLETEYWRKLHAGSIDVVYGEKGAGKSALYLLLNSKSSELFDRRVLLTSGEQVRGATAFADLQTNPPTSENEFILLWKIYIASLIGQVMVSYGVGGSSIEKALEFLRDNELLEEEASPRKILRRVMQFMRQLKERFSGITAEGSVDPITGSISVSGGVAFDRTAGPQAIQSDRLWDFFEQCQSGLESSDYSIWMLFDRLDVAFAETAELEANALRALFKAYLDLRGFGRIRLKIFLRSDIWRRITSMGFREASHITSSVKITWNDDALMNMIVKRIISSNELCSAFHVEKSSVADNIEA